MEQTESMFWKNVGFRFLRGFLAGSIGAMATITPMASGLSGLKEWFGLLAIAFIVGGVSGGVLALDKAVRTWKD